MIQKLIMNLTDSINTNDTDDSTDVPPCNPHTPSSCYVFYPISQEQVTLETSMMLYPCGKVRGTTRAMIDSAEPHPRAPLRAEYLLLARKWYWRVLRVLRGNARLFSALPGIQNNALAIIIACASVACAHSWMHNNLRQHSNHLWYSLEAQQWILCWYC